MPFDADPSLEGYTDLQSISHGPFGPSGQRTPTYVEILNRAEIQHSLQPADADSVEENELPAGWIDRRSVNCFQCGHLVAKRDCRPGASGEGDICLACQLPGEEIDELQHGNVERSTATHHPQGALP
jgi:hypothetical protein